MVNLYLYKLFKFSQFPNPAGNIWNKNMLRVSFAILYAMYKEYIYHSMCLLHICVSYLDISLNFKSTCVIYMLLYLIFQDFKVSNILIKH